MKDQKNINPLSSSMQHKAVITQEEVKSTEIAKANKVLREIGERINPTNGAKYLGSYAMHIYASEVLGTMFFIPQCGPLEATPELTASASFEVMRGGLKKFYGRRTSRKRSGLET